MQTVLLWIASTWVAVAILVLIRGEYRVLHGAMCQDHFMDRAKDAFRWPITLVELLADLISAIRDEEEA